ncbi:MAG TPA: hypothetical protein PLC59_02115 [Bacteroidales bacterium]|nr:hypothetical protein [Bacteroidales bacterium]
MKKISTAILLQLTKFLEKKGWKVDKDWKLTLKSEDYISFINFINIEGSTKGNKIKDNIQVYMTLNVETEDNWTYFISYIIYSQISIEGFPSKDISHKMLSNISFTKKDIKNEQLYRRASTDIDRSVYLYINEEFEKYIEDNVE